MKDNPTSKENKIILLPWILLLFATLLFSCENQHRHSFGEWEKTKVEDCVFDGEIRRVCQCGEVEIRTVGSLGHSYIDGVCQRCGIEGDSPENNLAKVIFTSRGDGTCAVTGYRDIISGSLIIPEISPKGDLVTEICQNALSYHKITDIVIPASVTVIGKYAFTSCYSLERVTVLGGLTEIGSNAFSGCRSLKTVILPDTLKVIGDYAFDGCKALTEIALPNGLTGIGTFAFLSCESLTEIRIPDGITVIERNSFALCKSLKSLIIPSGVTEIKSMAFYKCSSLENIYYKGSDTSWKAIQLQEYNDALEKADITYNYAE